MGNISWVFIVIIGVCIGVYYLYRQGRMPWLTKFQGKSVKIPKVLAKMFEPKAETQIAKLKAQTEKEVAKTEELRKILEEKRKLARALSEKHSVAKEIEGVSAKSVEKDKRDAEKEEKEAQDAKKARPKRL